MNNLLEAFDAAVLQYPERIALIDGHANSATFQQLKTRVQDVSAHFAHQGIGTSDRVLVAMPVGIELYVALCAIWALGGTAVFPEPALGLAGVRHAARVTQPKALCATGLFLLLKLLPEFWRRPVIWPKTDNNVHKPAASLDPEDIALISFTSGSTGAPKAIPRSHRFLMAQYRAVAPLLESAAEERDLVAFPIFALINLAEGRCTVLPNWKLGRHDKVPVNALQTWISQQNVTRLLLPPILCETLANAETPTSGVRAMFTGGGPVFPDIIARLQNRFPGMRIISIYGSTEAEPIAEIDTANISEADLHAMENGAGLLAGSPVPDIILQIENGEIIVSGPHVNKGYLDSTQDRDTKIKKDGTIWHRTGDAGKVDDQGRLWLLGRSGEVCQSTEGPLHPFAVETAARFWPGLRRAALASKDNVPVLFVEGSSEHLELWRKAARHFGINDVRQIPKIPMDRRHHSKVDSSKLRNLL